MCLPVKADELRALASGWLGKQVSIVYRTTTTSPEMAVLLPKRKMGRMNCLLVKKRGWNKSSTVCTTLWSTTQSFREYDQAPQNSERTQLGEHTTVISELPNAFVPKHVVEHYFGLRTLKNAWGTTPGLVLTMMPWDTALNYADRGLRLVTSSGIAPGDHQLQWWERKDRITRGAVAGLVRQHWPAQEALKKALADTNTDWTVVKGAGVKGRYSHSHGRS